mmetsp:Transcript_28342/g.71155  ORF Transcript_28342/g.71155 Transcript_28342/m.71155 type:complete len:374 (-) Transcript_28342:822-1943(-)
MVAERGGVLVGVGDETAQQIGQVTGGAEQRGEIQFGAGGQTEAGHQVVADGDRRLGVGLGVGTRRVLHNLVDLAAQLVGAVAQLRLQSRILWRGGRLRCTIGQLPHHGVGIADRLPQLLLVVWVAGECVALGHLPCLLDQRAVRILALLCRLGRAGWIPGRSAATHTSDRRLLACRQCRQFGVGRSAQRRLDLRQRLFHGLGGGAQLLLCLLVPLRGQHRAAGLHHRRQQRTKRLRGLLQPAPTQRILVLVGHQSVHHLEQRLIVGRHLLGLGRHLLRVVGSCARHQRAQISSLLLHGSDRVRVRLVQDLLQGALDRLLLCGQRLSGGRIRRRAGQRLAQRRHVIQLFFEHREFIGHCLASLRIQTLSDVAAV